MIQQKPASNIYTTSSSTNIYAKRYERAPPVQNKNSGVKFRRQQGIGRYIVDFYCSELNMVIEIDGDSHFTDEAINYDFERNEFLQGLGIKILRFTNDQICRSLDGVLAEILKSLTPS